MVAVAGARETREAGAGTSGLNGSEDESIGSLLMGGMRDEQDDDGAGDGEDQELDDGDEGDADDDGEDGGAGDESDDEDDEAGEPGTDAEASTAAARNRSEIDSWAKRVSGKPMDIMQVPGNRRKDVLTRAFAMHKDAGAAATREQLREPVQQALDAMYQQGLRDAREAATGEAEFAELEELAREDPEAFAELALSREGAAKAARYLTARAENDNPAPKAAADAIKASAARLMAKVNAVPSALAKLKERERVNPGRYEATADGLASLSEDIADVLAEARAEAAQKEKQPVAKAAAERRKAAEERGRLPRTGGSEGRGNGTGTDSSLFGSSADDLKAGFREMVKRR